MATEARHEEHGHGGHGHHEHGEHEVIYIHIDHKKYPTRLRVMTGAQIRALAVPPIGPEYDLFVETKGPGDDRKLADTDKEKIDDCDTFYSVLRQINPGVSHEVA
jgi:hypothetical protein